MKGYLGDILKIGIVLAVGFALFGIYKSGVPQMATDMISRFGDKLKNMTAINPMDMVNIAKSTFFLK
ncbi:hypothetical protein DY052_09115 [Apilactobacillus timberlakei]|uniref:hypothetical protein n=1 Tax=Apilactobacillus timberlakei TaxID=2008380 RepID=UPI00112B2ECD|nr:hypothetical protein [Apilactobacillus timberlakei]TPR12808.1 hypothetical protein DY052_09115 [Apilactobacillus timberlakei]